MRGTKAEINLNNVEYNYKLIKNYVKGADIFPVVKANAYGHGIIEVSRLLRKIGIKYLSVAFAEEAIKLRENGDTGNILLIVSGNPNEAEYVAKYNFETVISDIQMLKEYDKAAKKYNKIINLHLFLNTGMNRDGINFEDAELFMQEALKYKNINIKGILTHFATAEFDDSQFADEQLDKFDKTVFNLKAKGYNFKYIHTANSGGIYNIKGAIKNAVRPGLSIYGYLPSRKLNEKNKFKPVLTLFSKILLIKKIKKGETVGYAHKYFADKDKNIAIVALGYGDGYTTLLTNKGKCIINGKKYNIIGSVCMDQLMVDLENDYAEVGDKVVFIGKQGKEKIDVFDISDQSGLIPYEVLTLLTERLPRTYIFE